MTRRAALTLALWLGALAACVVVIVHTRFSADLSAFLPAAPDPRRRWRTARRGVARAG